jgi:hypothetical protein
MGMYNEINFAVRLRKDTAARQAPFSHGVGGGFVLLGDG